MSQHWYLPNGNPCHTVIAKNGKERATTLRDARKLNLFPSVTTIMSVGDKPALNEWLKRELLDFCVNNPYHPLDWELDAWKRAAIVAMKDKGKKAAERGTEIHNKLEDYYKTENVCENDRGYIIPAIVAISSNFPLKTWTPEATFATNGFAGCCDLHCDDVIIDFKTKNVEDIQKVEQYDDHKMQLAAYQVGLKLPSNTRRFNLFINVNEELPKERLGECKLVECSEYNKYIEMFECLQRFWELKNNYKAGE